MNWTLLTCALVLFVATVTLAAPTTGKRPGHKKLEDKAGQKTFLQKFGYWVGAKDSKIEEDFTNSVKKYQKAVHLPETGVVDKETLQMMLRARCSIVDEPNLENRQKRYGVYNFKWRSNDITYSYLNYTTDLPQAETKAALAKAFKFWSDVTPLTFREVASDGKIQILWASKAHGDGVDFDGEGSVLAHGFYPLSGRLHFDEEETWTVNSEEGVDLVEVATHELGHVLGLLHSNKGEAVMFAYYKHVGSSFKLDNDDIKGIQKLYGPNPTMTTTTAATTTTTKKNKKQ